MHSNFVKIKSVNGWLRINRRQNVQTVFFREEAGEIPQKNRPVKLTRICVGPHPLTISLTGRLRYGQVSLELTRRRMSASPCWPSQAHPSGLQSETEQGQKKKKGGGDTVEEIGGFKVSLI